MDKGHMQSEHNIAITNPENVFRAPYKRRRSSLMVEIGKNVKPTVHDNITPVDIQKMMEAGVNIAKFKTSSTTEGERVKLLGKMDTAAATAAEKNKTFDWPIATCGALKTCIVKTGLLKNDVHDITLEDGSEVILTCDVSYFDKCNEKLIFVDNSHLAIDINVGMEVTIDEGKIIMFVCEITDMKTIKAVISKGGRLTNMCNVCVRGMKRSRPYITNKDLQITQFILDHNLDMILIYYVRHVETIKKVKEFIATTMKKRPIIFAATCTQEGIDNIDDVIKECDGIVMGREYLAYELENSNQYRMASIQKWLAGKCQQAGKPLFISGGVLGDMIANGILTERDMSDVTNALLDGVSGFILTDCFNIDNTIDAINEINELCCEIEPLTYNKTFFRRLLDVQLPLTAAEAAVHACATVAVQTEAQLIVLPTVTGATARALLQLIPSCLVITVSTNTRTSRLLSIFRCTVPLVYRGDQQDSWRDNVRSRVEFALEYAVSKHWVRFGDVYVTLSRGTDTSCYCDTVRVSRVDILKKAMVECEDDGNLKNKTASTYSVFTIA